MRKTLIGLVILLCAGGVLTWQLMEKSKPAPTQPAAQLKQQPPIPAKPALVPVVAEVSAPTKAEDRAAQSSPAPQAAAETPLTAETLAGTRWQDDKIDIAFLPDGRWQMNGRICAKWEVNGDKVRIFDDKGEEHFVDIVGSSLAFNGKKIGRASS
ncbi:MAG: hypothetical protein K1Y02_17005 [Candidatus Hydrogenedentes bacterium]|nr:hypothetical protein [Candidatus Hydrogenedentota bacterium]